MSCEIKAEISWAYFLTISGIQHSRTEIIYNSALRSGNGSDYKKAMEFYQKGADNGSAFGYYGMGRLYYSGKGELLL